MDVYKTANIAELIHGNSYVGRGIVAGTSKNGKYAVCAYFIMGRSENSRNRIFEEKDGEIFTKPFDASLVKDPSLIIYRAVREYKNNLIVTNGDQTDTIYDGLKDGLSFEDSLETRTFEPDAPNFTPRISALLSFNKGGFSYRMSILKSIDAAGSGCCRQSFSYPMSAGLGHFIHTYVGNGTPLPSFCGEPERISVPDDIDSFTASLWDALDSENKISLYVCYSDLETGKRDTRIINKNKGETK